MAGTLLVIMEGDPEEQDAPVLMKVRLFDHVLNTVERQKAEVAETDFAGCTFSWTTFGDEAWLVVREKWLDLGSPLEP